MAQEAQNMKQLFKGIAKAKVSMRSENPKLGRAWYLLNKTDVFTDKNQVQHIRRLFTCVLPLRDSHGREPGMDNYDGEMKGSQVSSVIFGGLYFDRDMKKFVLTGMGFRPEDEDELIAGTIADLKASDPSFKPAPDETEADAAWGIICAQVCGLNGEAGAFDNNTVFELDTIERVKNTGKYVKDSSGNLVEEVSVRSYTNLVRKVSLSEVAESVEQKDIAKYFGSLERFNELLGMEG